MLIQKRDGRTVEFDRNKIIAAVEAAFRDVDGGVSEYAHQKAENIATYIEGALQEGKVEPEVEAIQDIVECGLQSTKRKDVAKAYILYRDKRSRERQYKTKWLQTYREKIMAENVQNQNANVDEKSFGGRNGEAASATNRQYALDYLVSPMARDNHLNNEIYIHDLDAYITGCHNCLSIPFDDLLAKGFNTRQTDIRPANSINTAFQLTAVIFQIQSLQQFGGCSATHFDWTMVPYVRKSFAKHYKDGLIYVGGIDEKDIDYEIERMIEDPVEYGIDDQEYAAYNCDAYRYAHTMTLRELNQAAEGLLHNLNSLQSRSGNQLPFTSINYGTCTLTEGRMITRAILEATIKGIGKKHRTSIFPCQIFQCMKGVNRTPDDPNYDLYQLALRSTAQRLYPNYCNVDWSGNAGYDKNDPCTYFSTMGLN